MEFTGFDHLAWKVGISRKSAAAICSKIHVSLLFFYSVMPSKRINKALIYGFCIF